ncbi:UNVERIFIED_CONTAM: hypothetical protein Cloal_4011 [Acetivibrio alkalicellulosi]
MSVFKNSKGSTSVIFISSIIVVVLISAFITDIGYIAIERYKFSKDLNSIVSSEMGKFIQGDEKITDNIIKEINKKYTSITNVDIKVSENGREMTLYADRNLHYIFLKHLGFIVKPIDFRVTAKGSNVNSYRGIRPFALIKTEIDFEKERYLSFIINEEDNKKMFHKIVPLALGKQSFNSNIIHGYWERINVGDTVTPYSGEIIDIDSVDRLMSGCKNTPYCTYDNYKDGCSKIIIIPVVEELEDSIKVIGFSAFFIEEGNFDKQTGNVTLKGRFIRYIVNETISDGIPDFGLLGVRLIN